ncbi:MAG: hypothetical protein HY842_14395 [Bacteroidetes bacterium]|nr:hypothetical protein [Bacteroidota bacterium]
MKQFNFFQKFSEKIQAASPPPDFSGEDWQTLSRRLDAHERRRLLPLWWLGALTGLLLLSNAFWIWQWWQSEAAKPTASQASVTDRETTVNRDTIFRQTVVYQYDTIYRTVVVRQPFFGKMAANGVTGLGSGLPRPGGSSPLEARNAAGTPGQTIAQQNSSSSVETADQTPSLLPFPDLLAFVLPQKKPSAVQPPDLVMLPAKKENKTAFPLVPQGVRIGASGGSWVPVANSLASKNGYMVGLSGEIVFADYLALTLDAGYGAVKFKGFVYEEGLGLPPLNPPGDEYDLKYFETHDGNLPMWQVSAGMRWWLAPRSKLSPYLGAAFAAHWQGSYELEFEYQHRTTGMEKGDDVDVPASSKPLPYGNLNLGLRYRFSKHWLLQGGANLDFKLDRGQAGIPRYWGLRAGILREF